MATPLNRQPAWVIATVYCAGAAVAVLIGEVAGEPAVAGVLVLALAVTLIPALVGRPDGQGLSIFGTLLAPSVVLDLIGWPMLVSTAIYVVVTPLLAALAFDRTARPRREPREARA